jgi:oligoribonuclease NrnB/cAMP/cGMP phosphodiesterase (DHH superfamily)
MFPEVGIYIDSWNNIKKYESFNDAFFIFDEQRVVGKGAWVKSFYKITKKNQWILLTATPGDDWSDYIPVFSANGFYRNRTEFLSEHAVYNHYITKFPKIEKYVGTKRLCKYRDTITVYMHFNKKTVPHTNYILAEYDRTQYKALMKDRWNIYKDEPIKNISELCALLRKVVNSDSSRIEETRKLIEKHRKVIIFYNFDFELQILKDLGEEMKIETREWNGHQHDELPDADEWIYLVQYAAGAEGWNCITTDTIIFYSLNYSYKATVQAAGRIDRLNTPFTDLNYYYIYSHSPIDLAIRRCLQQKKNFNESKFINKS